MRSPYRLIPAGLAAFSTTLTALLLTACAVPGAPPHASIYPKGHYEAINDPGLALDVDFDRHAIRIDIYAERYTGELVWLPAHNSFQAHLLTSSGARMECTLTRLLPKVWSGECTDSQGQVYVLGVGHHWSV